MEDPSWFAWHNSTVPTEERERDGIWFGNRHACYTWDSWHHKRERQRNENTATPPSVGWGHPGKPPALVRGVGRSPPPSPSHAHLFFFQWGLVVEPGFRSGMEAAQHTQKGALEISEMGLPWLPFPSPGDLPWQP